MPAVNLSPVFNDAQLDSSGNPYVGALVFTYAAGSSTPATTYTSSAGSVAQSNPIVLNARGEPTNGPIWLTDGSSYKFVLAAPGDTVPSSPIRTIDNVTGVNDAAAAAQSEWVASALTPTYVSSSSFTLSGDQTTEFHVGRRLKLTDGGGTDYAAISKSAHAAGTTTITIDATTLTTPVSAVSLGISSAVNPSDPLASSSIISPGSPLTAFENLAIATTSVTAATITADKVVVRNAAGTAAVLSTVSLTVAITTAGANGLDTGAEAPSTGYFLWVIWNGATVAGLLSASSTAPTMPSGYTHKGLVGAVYNTSGSDFLGMNQKGRFVSIVSVTALSLGSATSVTSVSLSTAIPPNAWQVLVVTLLSAIAATGVAGTVYTDSAGAVAALRTGNVSTTDAAFSARSGGLIPLRTAQTLWYNVTDVNADLSLDVVGYIW